MNKALPFLIALAQSSDRDRVGAAERRMYKEHERDRHQAIDTLFDFGFDLSFRA
jgi:hypothetical protein